MLFIFNHFVLAPSNKTRRDFEVKYVFKKDEKGQRKDRHFFINSDTKVFVKNFSKMDTTGTNFRIEQFEGQELVSVLKTNVVKWMGNGVWRLTNYQIRDLKNGRFEDHQGETIDTMIQMYPSDFISYLHEETTLTTPEIKKYIANQKGRAIGNTRKYTIEMHKRSADPVSIIILTIIGVALASRKRRGGMGVHLAGGIGIGAMFIFFSRVSATFSMNSDIPESLGMWIPNIVFGLASIWLVYKAQQ
jgi:lipopolysaccharide export system permease protein